MRSKEVKTKSVENSTVLTMKEKNLFKTIGGRGENKEVFTLFLSFPFSLPPFLK